MSEHEAAAAIAKRTGVDAHDIAVVLGSGWRPAADVIGEYETEIPFAELPGFTTPGAVGPRRHHPFLEDRRQAACW